MDVFQGCIVHGHHAGPGAGLDRHVAQRHPPIHRQRLDRGAHELDGMPGRAAGADASDQRERQILGVDAFREGSRHAHRHVSRLGLGEALGGHDVFDLGGADALGQGCKRAMSGGMGVSADDGHARQGRALLRPDDVHDSLADVVDVELGDAMPPAVVVERDNLLPRHGVGDSLYAGYAAFRRYVVVRGGQVGLCAPQFAAGKAQAFKCLGRGDLVHKVTVDVEQTLPVRTGTGVVIGPDFVVQSRHGLPLRMPGKTGCAV